MGRKRLQIIYLIKDLAQEYIINDYNSIIKQLLIHFFEWVKELNRHFSKEYRQMIDKLMKICSTSLATREMQINTTIRPHQDTYRGHPGGATVKNLPARAGDASDVGRGFDPWVRKIPWSRKRQATPVFWPGGAVRVQHNSVTEQQQDSTKSTIPAFW